jgi:seryl-tRNA synthetase
MIDLEDFREHPHKYRHAAEVKRVNVDVDHVLRLDGERLRSQQAFERLRAEQNEFSKQIAALKDAAARQAAIARGADLKLRVKQAEDRTKTIEHALLPLLLLLPQPPDDEVHIGKDDAENVELKKWGEIRHFDFPPKDQ